jgi:hypothetical protein
MRILLLTVARVLKREGMASAGHATLPEFTGAGATDSPRGGEVSGAKLLVNGARGNGKRVTDSARSAGFTVTAFVDDGLGRRGSVRFGARALPLDEAVGVGAVAGVPARSLQRNP